MEDVKTKVVAVARVENNDQDVQYTHIRILRYFLWWYRKYVLTEDAL